MTLMKYKTELADRVNIDWMINNGPTPTHVIKRPPIAGTHNLIILKAIEFRAKALIIPSLGIIEASRDIRLGSFIVHEIPIKSTKINKPDILSLPAMITTPNIRESIA